MQFSKAVWHPGTFGVLRSLLLSACCKHATFWPDHTASRVCSFVPPCRSFGAQRQPTELLLLAFPHKVHCDGNVCSWVPYKGWIHFKKRGRAFFRSPPPPQIKSKSVGNPEVGASHICWMFVSAKCCFLIFNVVLDHLDLFKDRNPQAIKSNY